jgi:CHAT domain
VDFDEFRLVVQPDVHNPANWSINVQDCPRAMFEGPQQSIAPVVKPEDLAFLRNASAPPDLAALRALGKAVLDSLMPQNTQTGLGVCLDDLRQSGRGLRIVVSILGGARRPGGGVGCHEVPVEALFSNNFDFLATNVKTPVSRGITFAPDRRAVRVAPPLRILVVVSEPTDMPPVHAAAEWQSLTTALNMLVTAGAVEMQQCKPPTLTQLGTLLQQQVFHIVHFIGHGDFEISGADPNPQPHLYFEDDTLARYRRGVDAEQFYTAIRNGNVPLVVMTACATAATAPNGPEYPGLAFEGIAQALVERHSGPLAAVGMQFDFETDAAATFSRALYEALLNRAVTIDQAVASARSALVTRFSAAHRAWVNPTLYWRCINGQIFEILDTAGTLTPQQQEEINTLDSLILEYEQILNDLKQQPPEIVQATAILRTRWQEKIEALMQRRGLVLGDSVRLRGGQIGANGEVECRFSLQIRSGATIGDVRATVQYDDADFEYLKCTGVPGGPDVFTNAGAGKVEVFVQNASANNQWNAGEHQLALVKFRLKNAAAKTLFRIPLSNISAVRDGGVTSGLRALHAIVFGT